MPTRREFLSKGLMLVSVGFAAPAFLAKTGYATPQMGTARALTSRGILVVVQLSGGNDGLNTVIPYRDPLYHELRPQLGLTEGEALPLDDSLALHPALAPLKARYDAGQLAIVRGVGYPNPNRSHFRSMDIWQTAEPAAYAQSGWLGRYLASCECSAGARAGGVAVGQSLPRAFWTEGVFVPALTSLEGYRLQTDPRWPADRDAKIRTLQALDARHEAIRPYADFLGQQSLNALASADELQRVAGGWQTPVGYPETPFAQGLKAVGRLIAGDLGARVYYVQLGGFDTHAQQKNTQQRLLDQLAAGLDAFQNDLEAMGKADRVLTMTFSEFGRRVHENGSQGTDHGTAEPMFLLGAGLKGGLYGAQPPLDDLDNGDLRYQVDFRAVYATALERWLGAGADAVLGASYPLLDFVA
ncbi:MAG TPA: DUF1501 domain-containing protein [Chloroflexota bacterium]|nr:DUF1501 domain-containing protein [Chloroflexota bacterium]